MSGVPPPLRFLAAAVAGWALLRAALLVPDGREAQSRPALRPRPAPAAPLVPTLPAIAARKALPAPIAAPRRESRAVLAAPALHRSVPMPAAAIPAKPAGTARASPPGPSHRLGPPGLEPARREDRWSASAWLLARRERGGPALAPGGTLGGSQAGARFLYRLGGGARRLALSARLYAPLRRAGGAEAAAGIDWRPLARLPLHLLAERRQALGADGRSAFALTLYGGHSARLPGGLRLDAYGQAGLVGLRSRDPFADGAVRLAVPLGPVEIGGGAWGAAQPGAARLDVGPLVALPLRVRGAGMRLSADWRFRAAGDAAPDSGPALTLASDF